VETAEQRRRRLGALLKTRRKTMKIPSAKKLSELTGNAVGTRTIEAVEAGERVISSSNYHVLEIQLKLPIGTMESVLRGELAEFPDSAPTPGQQAADTEEDHYTKPEIRAIYRALGAAGFEEWLLTNSSGRPVRTVG
jgi:hypothetical protein